MEYDTAKKVHKEATAMSNGCEDHRSIIEFVRGTSHQGYTISYDESMLLAYYKDGVVIIDTYGHSTLLKKYE